MDYVRVLFFEDMYRTNNPYIGAATNPIIRFTLKVPGILKPIKNKELNLGLNDKMKKGAGSIQENFFEGKKNVWEL